MSQKSQVIEVLDAFFANNTLSDKMIKELTFAKKIIEKDLALQTCTAQSILNCLESAVKCGLSLNPVLNLCYLATGENNVCKLEISYLGFIKILKDSGSVKHIDAHIIYDDEKYFEDTATGLIRHEKKYVITEEEQRKRNIVGLYCFAILPDNTRIHSQIFPIWEIEKRKKIAPGFDLKGSYWEKWKEDMYKKTAIRMWWKFLIKGDVGEALQTVLEIDNTNSGFEKQMQKPQVKKQTLSQF